jgi:hypothetical protein
VRITTFVLGLQHKLEMIMKPSQRLCEGGLASKVLKGASTQNK